MSNRKLSARQRRLARLRIQWKEKRGAARQARTGRYARGKELIRTLKLMHESTGDPVFDDALRAARAYGFDESPALAARRADATIFGSDDDGDFAQIRFLIERGVRQDDGGNWRRAKVSIREACQIIAAEQGRPAASFEAAAEQLRQKFIARRQRCEPATDVGDLGYSVEVVAAAGTLGQDGKPTPTHSVQRNTLFWRKKFRQGRVSIKFLRD